MFKYVAKQGDRSYYYTLGTCYHRVFSGSSDAW